MSRDAEPPQLAASEEVHRCNRRIGVAAALAVAGLGVAVAVPGGAQLDPGGCAVCGYIFFLFCFQSGFLEWPEPELSGRVLLLLAAALGALLAPAGLQAWGLWEHRGCRLAAWALDAALFAAGYRYLIHVPACDLPAGSLAGRTCVITGCNTGIGYETAVALARAGGKVVFACRNEAKARAAMRRLVEEAAGAVAEDQLVFVPLDVASLRSVRRFAELLEEGKLSAQTLILNAGVMMRSRVLSEDGFELTMASNHFGHFLLVQLLLPGLLAAEARGEKPRVVVVGSNLCYLHDRFDFGEVVQVKGEAEKKAFLKRPYSMMGAYGQSKLANLLFVTELARRLRGRGSAMPANAVHPGEVNTEVMRDMHPIILWLYGVFKPLCYLFFKSARQGSVSTVHVATSPGLATADGASGAHFVRLRPALLPKACRDASTAARLWALSEQLTGGAAAAAAAAGDEGPR